MSDDSASRPIKPNWGESGYLDGRWARRLTKKSEQDDGWFRRVIYVDGNGKDGGFACRPNPGGGHQLIVHKGANKKRFKQVVKHLEPDRESGDFIHHDIGRDHVLLEHHTKDITHLCKRFKKCGVPCEPNYVLFSDAGHSNHPHPNEVVGNPLIGNPLIGNPLIGNPLIGNPLIGNPTYPNGPFASNIYEGSVWGTPVHRSPLYSDRHHAPAYRDTGRLSSGARPTTGEHRERGTEHAKFRVIVLDTGIAADKFLPSELRPPPGMEPMVGNTDELDTDKDFTLDPVNGHGTFIGGILERLAPGVNVEHHKVLSSFGDGDVATVHEMVCHGLSNGRDPDFEYTIFNMSFSGYLPEECYVLAGLAEHIIEHNGVVVASAGNDAIGRPSYPASVSGVIGVGGLGGQGPAAFTNYGPWIRACAPAVDLTSCFYDNPEVPGEDNKRVPLLSTLEPMPGMPRSPSRFEGWARWTGTSFAGPIVAAALVREMNSRGCPAQEAVKTVVDGPDLLRIPYLGTVINLCPPLPDEPIEKDIWGREPA